MSDNPCPCTGGAFPVVVYNAPAQPAISYRWGDYTGFRSALLQPAVPPLPAETELTQPGGAQIWRPTPDSGDLALQVAEWWAYLADILTLYTERAANQAYIGTADLPESLPQLVPLLGYRPRPAIGAQLTLAGLVRGPRPVTLPQGLQVQSKPGPGQQPQVFELTAATVIQPVAPVATLPQTTPMATLPTSLTPGQGAAGQVLVAGSPRNLKLGDEVLLVSSTWAGADGNYAICNVTAIAPATGGTNIGLNITAVGGGTGSPGASNWRLLKSASSSTIYSYLQGNESLVFGSSASGSGFVQLSSVVRSIAPGDIILIENPSAGTANPPLQGYGPVLGYVSQVDELVYYANNPTQPNVWPPSGSSANTTEPAIPIPHTQLAFSTPNTIPGVDIGTLVVRYGYAAVGTLVDAPVTGAVQTSTATLNPAALATAGLASSGLATPGLALGSALLIADANGDGATATLGTSGVVTVDPAAPTLVPPLQVFSNLLAFTRGKTIANEVLGNGNPAIAGQDFTLQTAPVTYLADQPGRSGQGYSSTVSLWVNNVQWAEVPSFFGQGPNAQVFVTQEDDQGKTHVLGGDGVNGMLFPSGVGNVIASYRTGSGAALPPPTSVTVLMQPQPGLSALVNPVPPYGGADAAAPSALRLLAPQSVVTFGRAVSVDDYAAIAAATPGVARVSAAYAFDPVQQRPVVTLWVGDDANAVTAARSAIAPISDPNRPISILQANPVQISISLTYVRDPAYLDPPVNAALQTALAGPNLGLFGSAVVQIGQAFYDSQIYAACLAVPGVQAVHSLQVTVGPPPIIRYFWQLSSVWVAGLRVLRPASSDGCTGHRYSPGADGFFVLQNTPATLQLTGTAGT
jgi:hypothetical protein